jgi:hypothetical protein
VYLETTIPSYLSARPTRDLIRAAHQKVTKDWWRNRRAFFDVYVSQLVHDEARAGDSEAAERRLRVIKGLPLLDITPEVVSLTRSLNQALKLPARAEADAAHIAISAVHSMEFLLTWNCVHIANAEMFDIISATCNSHGFTSPVICTPHELMGVSL